MSPINLDVKVKAQELDANFLDTSKDVKGFPCLTRILISSSNGQTPNGFIIVVV